MTCYIRSVSSGKVKFNGNDLGRRWSITISSVSEEQMVKQSLFHLINNSENKCNYPLWKSNEISERFSFDKNRLKSS